MATFRCPRCMRGNITTLVRPEGHGTCKRCHQPKQVRRCRECYTLMCDSCLALPHDQQPRA